MYVFTEQNHALSSQIFLRHMKSTSYEKAFGLSLHIRLSPSQKVVRYSRLPQMSKNDSGPTSATEVIYSKTVQMNCQLKIVDLTWLEGGVVTSF